jgi:hypothetical protein
MAREDHDRTTANIGTQTQESLQRSSQTQETRVMAASLMPRPTTVREALHLVRGNYEHGHPGLPPKDYKAPKESRR